ncbi:MAG: hypothetical protein ACKOX6_11310, partial [Bdellovibrio sp.]
MFRSPAIHHALFSNLRDYDLGEIFIPNSVIVPKVAEQCMVNGWRPEQLIKLMSDPFDFMARVNTPRG